MMIESYFGKSLFNQFSSSKMINLESKIVFDEIWMLVWLSNDFIVLVQARLGFSSTLL